MMKKEQEAITMIGGNDGPTAVFRAEKKRDLRSSLRRRWFVFRRKRAMEKVVIEPHTMRETMDYMVSVHGMKEMEKDSDEYRMEYAETRASLIQQIRPELLGEYASIPIFGQETEEEIEKAMKYFDERWQRAMTVSEDIFDLKFHLYEKKQSGGSYTISVVEKPGLFGLSAFGSNRSMNRANRVYRDVIKYYGVTERDVERRSMRYRLYLDALMEQ